jgi:hypothetical protein
VLSISVRRLSVLSAPAEGTRKCQPRSISMPRSETDIESDATILPWTIPSGRAAARDCRCGRLESDCGRNCSANRSRHVARPARKVYACVVITLLVTTGLHWKSGDGWKLRKPVYSYVERFNGRASDCARRTAAQVSLRVHNESQVVKINAEPSCDTVVSDRNDDTCGKDRLARLNSCCRCERAVSWVRMREAVCQ